MAEQEFLNLESLNIKILKSAYQGSEYSDDEIESSLVRSKVNYRKSNDIAKEAALSISQEKIIGWFQGRMEVGARSLGSRSILASPINSQARDLVNINVKNREPWRPFAHLLRKIA